jgi:hypothetical protein
VNAQRVYMLNSTGRICFPFRWESKSLPQPWNDATHMRVMIPLSEKEKERSEKKCHFQIVRRSKITEIKTGLPKLNRQAEGAAA